MHLRGASLLASRRADGLCDTKAAPFTDGRRGEVGPGERLRGMWLRLTVDAGCLWWPTCDAFADHTHCAPCPQAAPDPAALADLRIGPGFSRAVA